MILFSVVILLVLTSGLFTALEIAFFSLDEIEIMSIIYSKHKNSEKLQKLRAEKDHLLLGLLICSNAINISCSALNAYLSYNLSIEYGINPDLAVTISTLVLTVSVILFAEAIPKIIGIRLKAQICLKMAPFLYSIYLLSKPITNSLLWLMKSFSKIKTSFGNPKPDVYKQAFVGLAEKNAEEGVFRTDEAELIRNTMALSRDVSTIMRPRKDVFGLKSVLTVKEALELVTTKIHSRFPVYTDNLDNIIGVVHIRSLFKEHLEGNNNITVAEIASKPIFVGDSWSIWNVLNILRSAKKHLGIVVDEFGGMSGIVSMEDVLEELVGDIDDEKDTKDSSPISQINEREWFLMGSSEIRTINNSLEIDLPLEDDFETLQGFLMHRLKKIPEINDQVLYNENWQFIVTKMVKNEVKQVKVVRLGDE